jgi:hypothetical protein
VQIPSQNFLAPRGRRVSRRENALNLCFRPGSVNGQMGFGGPRRGLESRILAVRGQRRRSGSPLIYEIKMARRESERNCGRRGAKFADGSRWAPRTPERLAAARAFDGSRQGPPGRSDHSPVQLSGGSPWSSGSMPGPGLSRRTLRPCLARRFELSASESPCSAGGAISWSRLPRHDRCTPRIVSSNRPAIGPLSNV